MRYQTPLTKNELSEIYRLRNEGFGIFHIARELNRSHSTMQHHLRKIDAYLSSDLKNKNFEDYFKKNNGKNPFKEKLPINKVMNNRIDILEDKILILGQHIEIILDILKERE